MPEYIAPSWVGRPADPALHYGQGFQMGVHLGAQQAAQAFQQQQLAQQQQRMALAQQQQEFENQMQAQVLSLKVGEMARQHQASQMFQQRVAMGEDPTRVLMELAPALGESPAGIIRAQQARDNARAMMDFRQSNMARLIESGQARQQEAAARLAESKAKDVAAAEKEARVAKQSQQRIELQKASQAQRARQAAEKQLEQNAAYLKLQADLSTATRLLNERISKGKGLLGLGSQQTLDKEVDALTKKVAEKELAIKRFHDQFVDAHPPAAFTPLGGELGEGEDEGEGVGDNTLPDVTPKATQTQERVRMKAPNGKTGTLPSDQVEAAIAQGWTRL